MKKIPKLVDRGDDDSSPSKQPPDLKPNSWEAKDFHEEVFECKFDKLKLENCFHRYNGVRTFLDLGYAIRKQPENADEMLPREAVVYNGGKASNPEYVRDLQTFVCQMCLMHGNPSYQVEFVDIEMQWGIHCYAEYFKKEMEPGLRAVGITPAAHDHPDGIGYFANVKDLEKNSTVTTAVEFKARHPDVKKYPSLAAAGASNLSDIPEADSNCS